EALRRHALGIIGKAGAYFRLRLRVQAQLDAGGAGCARAGVIVGGRADAAEAEHDVAGSERALQRDGYELRIVTQVLTPSQLQSARAEQLDRLREVLVLPLAGQD